MLARLDLAEEVADELVKKNIRSIAVKADVTKPDDVQAMVDTIVGALGGLTIGVNNAGIGQWADAESMSYGDWLRMAWDAAQVPYLGLWVDEGALNAASVAAPEPATGFYDSLALAWQKRRVTVLQPGAEVTWWLTVQLGTSEERYE